MKDISLRFPYIFTLSLEFESCMEMKCLVVSGAVNCLVLPLVPLVPAGKQFLVKMLNVSLPCLELL